MHTDGPWIAEEQFNPKDSGYRTTGRIFARTRHIASIHTADSVAESDANARLIAAAPALAAVCLEIREHDTDDWTARMRTLNAALAMAGF